MKIQQFNGGLNTRLAPQMLQLTQGVRYSNIDPTTGTLLPLKDKLDSGIETEQYAVYYRTGDEWISSDIQTEYLEFQGVLYSVDGGRPKKYSNGVSNNLGITNPSTVPTTTVKRGAATPDDFSVISEFNTGGDLPTNNINYLIANYDSVEDKYSIPYVFTSQDDGLRAKGQTYQNFANSLIGRINLNTDALSDRTVTISDVKTGISTSFEVYRYYAKNWRLVGSMFFQSSSVVDDTLDISTNDVFDEEKIQSFNGTYQYVYTYYNVDDGTESAPSPVSEELDVQASVIEVSNIVASADPQVTHIRLYRVGGNITQFSLVEELTNENQSYEDRLKDSEIEGTQLESDNYYEAPTGLRYLSEAYAMLFGAIGSTLRFTPIGVPNAWPPEYSLAFDTDITGIAPVANGILVMTEFRTFIVTGTGPFTLAQQTLRGDQGCISHSSIQEVTEGMAIWASADGLCTSSGNNVVVVSKSDLGKRRLDPVDSAVVDEVYYCLESDGNILIWDYRFTPIFREAQPGVSSLAVAQSEVYGWSEGKQYVLFKDTNNLEFTYKSPRYIEGSLTLPKTYKKFYFRHDGDIIINIIIDDDLVATKSLTGKNTTEFQVPSDKQRGFYVQFEITGTGELSEIEYKISETRNG